MAGKVHFSRGVECLKLPINSMVPATKYIYICIYIYVLCHIVTVILFLAKHFISSNRSSFLLSYATGNPASIIKSKFRVMLVPSVILGGTTWVIIAIAIIVTVVPNHYTVVLPPIQFWN